MLYDLVLNKYPMLILLLGIRDDAVKLYLL